MWLLLVVIGLRQRRMTELQYALGSGLHTRCLWNWITSANSTFCSWVAERKEQFSISTPTRSSLSCFLSFVSVLFVELRTSLIKEMASLYKSCAKSSPPKIQTCSWSLRKQILAKGPWSLRCTQQHHFKLTKTTQCFIEHDILHKDNNIL